MTTVEKDTRPEELKNPASGGKPAKPHRPTNWIWMGFAAATAAACIFTMLYGLFESRAESFVQNPFEQADNVEWLYKKNQILYRDLYNTVNNTELDYADLYYPLESSRTEDMENRRREETGPQNEAYEETEEDYLNEIYENAVYAREQVENYFTDQEGEFSYLNENYDYMILDRATGKVQTNTGETAELNPDNYHFYLKFIYDENGNLSIGNTVKGDNGERLRKLANEAIRSLKLPSSAVLSVSEGDDVWKFMGERGPVNCEITYGITQEMWNRLQNEEVYAYQVTYNGGSYSYGMIWDNYGGYLSSGCYSYYLLFLLGMFLLAVFLPYAGNGKPYKTLRMCRLPLEALVIIGILLAEAGGEVVRMAFKVGSGRMSAAVTRALGSGFGDKAEVISYLLNIIFLTALFAAAWYAGICFRGIREQKALAYLKGRSLIYRFFPFIKEKLLETYNALAHFDVTRNAKKLILKIVLVNAVVLFIICSFWVGGMPVAVIYSALLYFLLKKYVSDLQKKYGVLLNATNQIAEGNLNVSIVEDLGVFEPFKPQIIRIQRGFRNAVEEEVKSQRMKAELITNVSHDLKTPLTAITTYIGLLKNENITEEQRREYLEILERKSQRLKVLIEDLFEVSKATTQNVTLNIMDVDIMNLIKQVELEMSDKLENARLDVRMSLSDSRIILPLDSQKTYRIYENLFGNIAKYALPGTRVYVNGFQIDDTVVITLKNITAEEIHVTPEELTDRFVRGDVSRNTEGSGLGLAIAKSFTELQGGRLEIEVDGDLFKVTTVWTVNRE